MEKFVNGLLAVTLQPPFNCLGRGVITGPHRAKNAGEGYFPHDWEAMHEALSLPVIRPAQDRSKQSNKGRVFRGRHSQPTRAQKLLQGTAHGFHSLVQCL